MTFEARGDPRKEMDWKKVLYLRYGTTVITQLSEVKMQWGEMSQRTGVDVEDLKAIAYPKIKKITEKFGKKPYDILKGKVFAQEQDELLT